MSLQIIEWPDFLADSPAAEGAAITIGVFDGIHLGHRKLIDRIVSRGPKPTVLTFKENPKKAVSPETYEGDLLSLKQKIAVFESLGLSRVILIDFSEEFCKLKGSDFLDLLRSQGKMAFLAIGSNFRCGYRRDTDADFIREVNERKGIPTEVLPPVRLSEGPVSSSRIRSAVISGDLKLAAALMSRNFELDVSDISPHCSSGGALVYDLGAVQRIVPALGRYPVRMHPGDVKTWADTETGKVLLPITWTESPIERLEFIDYQSF